MNNADVETLLIECRDELVQVKTLVDGLGMGSNIVPYLNKYSIVRACGAVEVSFKTIVTDYVERRSKAQIKRYLRKYVRESSKNPSYKNICSLLKDFDEVWSTEFKTRVKAHADWIRIQDSMQSLVDSRNEFAHGGHPVASVAHVQNYFGDFEIVLEILDDIVN